MASRELMPVGKPGVTPQTLMVNPCNREMPPAGFPRYALGLALVPPCYRTSPRASIPAQSPNITVVTLATQAYADLSSSRIRYRHRGQLVA
jgi:hypothetical protein